MKEIRWRVDSKKKKKIWGGKNEEEKRKGRT